MLRLSPALTVLSCAAVLAACQADPIRPEAVGPDVEALLARRSDTTRGTNNRGQVVGRSKINQTAWRGFVWEAGKGVRELGALSGYSDSAAKDINNAQPAMVAGTSIASNGNLRAVRWTLL